MEYFLARQPVFNSKMKVFGYDLSFRHGFDNFYSNKQFTDRAASKVITESFLLIGIDQVTGGSKAFIPFSRNLLLYEIAALFPKELLIVEIDQSVKPDEKVLKVCRKLRKSGYLIAVEDFVLRDIYRPYTEIVDIVKTDFIKTGPDVKKTIIEELTPHGIKCLMKNVNKMEDFDESAELGYTYFQGDFFRKPFVLAGRDVPGYKLNYLEMLRQINQPELDFNKIEAIIKQDVSLSFKLLRLINSAAFGLLTEIKSIKQALVMLGSREVKKWIALVALSNMGNDKPGELLKTSLLRAKFSEILAEAIDLGDKSSELFLMGLFSLIDAFIDQPFHQILEYLPLSREIKIALMGGDGCYREIYDIVLSYETANWPEVSALAGRLKIDEKILPANYLEAVNWVGNILQKS